MKVKALFISDVHLGSKGSKASALLEMLKQYEPEYLFIVGDFIDGC
jgi:UDP-2,3-diacylglucosamine pyrophosphatase LpxH